MYSVAYNKLSNNITTVFPCNLSEYVNRVRGLSSDTVEYLWLDHKAVSRVDHSDFISHPYNYAVLKGHTPSDNSLLKLQSSTGQTLDIDYKDYNKDDGSLNIPPWAKYLVIDYLIAPGGYGDGTILGGCGAYLSNVAVALNGNRNLYIDIGKPGTISSPTASPLILKIDGNEIYVLSGGNGSSVGDDSSVESYYNPVPGAGGMWVKSIGGAVFNGNSRSTSSPVNFYGGGGDSGNGQPGDAKLYFASVSPKINGPIIGVDILPSLQPTGTTYIGDPNILHKGSFDINVPQNANYLCVLYACSGGGYGKDNTGGQGSYMSSAWWRVYPGDILHIDIASGGSIAGTSDGEDTTITYKYRDTTIPLVVLKGGKSNGQGGKYIIGNESYLFNGKDNSTKTPFPVNVNSGNYGFGGSSGESGGDGILSYVFSSTPPMSVTVYDSREDSLYNQS